MSIPDWMGDLFEVHNLPKHIVGVLSIFVAILCGTIVGLERERRDKPAGLRTVILICVGSTIFTMASILLAGGFQNADRSRVAAQVVSGIGFLGAGAIIHERRAVVGLTTAATIWAVAAVGVVVGAGYAVPGIVLSAIIYLVLGGIKRMEDRLAGACRIERARVTFESKGGKTRALIQGLLDERQIDDADYEFGRDRDDVRSGAASEWVEISYCTVHRGHRRLLPCLAALPEVVSIDEMTR